MLSRFAVTLHVSVWVEILPLRYVTVQPQVTLHVSVWVEIVRGGIFDAQYESRSTWACELKFTISGGLPVCNGHAPR